MQKFDIFIKGINPERLDEADSIRANAAKALQISLSELDDVLAHPSVCIHRNATEEDAKTYQRTLNKLGLISLYSPVVSLSNLELIPMEEEIAAQSIECPHCEYEMTISEEGVEPEKCEQCGINIPKFLEQQKQNEEREAVKVKLLAAQAIIDNERLKIQQEEAEKKRKLELEKEVLHELHGSEKLKKPLNLKLLAIGSGLVIATAGASYFVTQKNVSPPSKNEEKKSANNVATAELDISKKTAAPMDAQQAIQKTHDQAAQFLNGFGLDADALANASSNGNALPPTESEVMRVAATAETVAPTTMLSLPVKSSESVATVKNETTNTPPVSSPKTNANALFAAINGDISWDSFLAKNSKILLDRQLPENAAKLSKFIIANDVYIDAIGALLHSAQQAKQTKLLDNNLAAIETRLTALSSEQQAIYFAQASRYLTLENGTNPLLTKAENLLASLQTPESQLKVILKLAVTYSKVGNIEKANNYFNKINGLLTAITDLDLQAQLRASVALAYHEINNEPVAVQWLNSTEPLLKQLKSETVTALLVTYAQCNQWQSILTLLSKMDTQYDLQLYRAIAASLKSGFVTNALELHKSLHAPVYKALADILIADYSPSTANELVATAEQLLINLSPVEKIVIANQLVDYYGRLKNTAKIEMFVTLVQDSLAGLAVSDEKDLLIEATIKHYTHGFQTKAASNLLTMIQSTPLKTRLNLEINQFADIGGLLK